MVTISAARLRTWFRVDVLVFGHKPPSPRLLKSIATNFKQSAASFQAKTPHVHIGTIQHLQAPFPVEFTRVSFSCQLDKLCPGKDELADAMVMNEQQKFAKRVLSMLAKKQSPVPAAVLVRNDNEGDIFNAGVLTLALHPDDVLTFRQREIQEIDERAAYWHRFWDNEECEPSMWALFQQWRPQQLQQFLVTLQQAHLQSALSPSLESSPAAKTPRF